MLSAKHLLLILGLCYVSAQVGAMPDRRMEDDYNADETADDDVDDSDDVPIKILSDDQTLEVNVGSTVKLPCKTDRPNEAVIQWRRHEIPLFLGATRQTKEERFMLDSKDYTLTIENVKSTDEDEYICQLLGEEPVQRVTHMLNVRTGPKIKLIIPDKVVMEEKEGVPITFMCDATGRPTPKVYWRRKNNVNESKIMEAEFFSYDRLTWRHSGNYTCVAEGEKGLTDERTVVLQVRAGPEVDVPSTIVNSAEKYESEIICNVHCNKCQPISWEKDGSKIKQDSRHYQVLQEGHRQILRISATKKSDFGQYTCVAVNQYGTANKTITLRGEPLKPSFESLKTSPSNQPILTWKINSKADVQAYEIIYKRQQDDDWATLNPEIKPGSNGVYLLTHTFTDLQPETYLAKLRVKNEYGFSELSDETHFPGGGSDDGDATQSMLAPSTTSGAALLELRISAVLLVSLLTSRFLR